MLVKKMVFILRIWTHTLLTEYPGLSEYIRQALNMSSQTEPFNITGHPALTVPAGLVNGLPVGLMIVAKHLDEVTAFRVGFALQELQHVE